MMIQNSSNAVPTLYFAKSGLGLLMSTPYKGGKPNLEYALTIMFVIRDLELQKCTKDIV